MIAFTVPLFILVLMTSDCLHGHPMERPSALQSEVPTRIKRAYAMVQHHPFDQTHLNDDALNNIDELLYSLVQRPNRKRLIDF